MKRKVVMFHLQDEDDLESEIKKKQNQFLDLYSLYVKTRAEPIKEALLQKAYELHVLDSNFTFHI
jgi:hypothetical protein